MTQFATEYKTLEPNADITLFDGPITFLEEGNQMTTDGTIFLRWLPSPRVSFHLNNVSHTILLKSAGWMEDPPNLSVSGSIAPVRAFVSQIHGGPSGTDVKGILDGTLDIGCPDNLIAVECHLTNMDWFGDFRPKDKICLQALCWDVEIGATDSRTPLMDLRNIGGYALTNKVRIRQRDGSSFSAADAELIRNSLFRFLSFVQGRKVGVILPVGYNADGNPVWRQWTSWVIDPWQSVFSWTDLHDTRDLGEAYSGFMDLWFDDGWREILNTAIHWYVEANRNTSGLDAGIVFTQMALELLAWHYFVVHKQAMTKEGYNRLAAADRIRLLLSQHDVPLDIPNSLPNLEHWAKELNQADAAEAIVAVRNTVVHPEIKQRERFASANNPKRDAWTCGLWMLELLLLRLFRYSDRYWDRREQKLDSVPWGKVFDDSIGESDEETS